MKQLRGLECVSKSDIHSKKKNFTQLTNVSTTNCSITLSLVSVSSAATNANAARNIKATVVRVPIVSMSKPALKINMAKASPTSSLPFPVAAYTALRNTKRGLKCDSR